MAKRVKYVPDPSWESDRHRYRERHFFLSRKQVKTKRKKKTKNASMFGWVHFFSLSHSYFKPLIAPSLKKIIIIALTKRSPWLARDGESIAMQLQLRRRDERRERRTRRGVGQ